MAALVPATRPIWLAVSPRGTQAGFPFTRFIVSTQSPAAHTSRKLVFMCLSTRMAPVVPDLSTRFPGQLDVRLHADADDDEVSRDLPFPEPHAPTRPSPVNASTFSR